MAALTLLCAFGLPALIIGLGVPLVLGRVRPNPWYGVRLARSTQSAQSWYDYNRRGGWAMILAGFASLSFSLVMAFFTSLNQTDILGVSALTSGLLPSCALLIAIFTVREKPVTKRK